MTNIREIGQAGEDLFNILKEFNIWRIGKYDKDLEDIKNKLKGDKYYIVRTALCEKLLEEPKYKELEESEKIKLILKIGALDTSDLSYSKETKEMFQ